MKRMAWRRQVSGGFTLVELLVVISIIVVLMGLLFPTIGTIKNAANKARAGAAISSLMTAAKSYYNEYGQWPSPTSDMDLVLTFNGLMNPQSGTKISNGQAATDNPRAIQFMEFRLKDVTVPGSASGQSPLAFYDPWGMPYAYCFDNGKKGNYYQGPVQNGTPSGAQGWTDQTAYDNQITVPFKDDSNATLITGGYAFFSDGPDTRTGTDQSDPGSKNPAKAYEDDVRSWR